MEVVLAQPRGFCAGVVRAIEIVELALDIYGPPVFVFHEIVHNRHVVEDLQTRGAVFIEDLDAVPTGSVTIFSAHGVSTAVVDQAKRRNLQVIDATCPLVTKVHLQAQQYSRRGYETIIIGHIGHEEVEGTMGSVEGPVYVVSTTGDVAALQVKNPDKLAYVTQTTLSIDDTRDVIDVLKQRFPTIQGPELDDICYATQNRQNAVKALADEVNLLLVVGARNSSNSNRLREVGKQHGVPAFLIQDETELDRSWFQNIKKVGITSGASTPEVLVQRVLDKLRSFGVNVTRELDGIRETTTFRLPKSLTLKKAEQTKTEPVAKINI
ncbi:MAG TPA: 4-hydroxy-3-methylbut-2-enyl diphosphate reductase [Burkholderiales bacterium]|jgi:4-hydroxy-3-methylbut-2-en-1-yl diphosphate reductase|nr:4-hydroxy-3-methylbut-2-enyl diphosphate reductase [Burkholderiales bacterium]